MLGVRFKPTSIHNINLYHLLMYQEKKYLDFRFGHVTLSMLKTMLGVDIQLTFAPTVKQ